MKKLITLTGFALTLAACNSESSTAENLQPADTVAQTEPIAQEAVFEPAFENIDVPFTEFNYNSRKGLTFDLETGSHIEIPADAFEDASGNPVTENIQVKYREFHSVSDIMLSGIKMKYNEGDTLGGDFETAGMFEIRAFQNGAELNLRKDKKINVDLASYKAGDFKHYKMNEGTGNWEFLEKKNPEKNTNKEKKLADLDLRQSKEEFICQMEPAEYKKGMEVFDLDYDLSRFPELSFVSEAMWMCVGSDEEKKLLDSTLTGFNDMELIPSDSCNYFTLNVWRKDGITAIRNKKTFTVLPVWSGKAYTRAQKNYRNQVDQMKKLQQERQIAEREADLWRSFELQGMGVFNCDRVLDYVKFVTVSLVLAFKDKIHSFFYITNNGSVAIKYYEYKFPEFKVNPNSTNSIIAILPDNKIGKVSEEEFEKALSAYRLNTDPNKTLELKVEESPIPVTDKPSFERHVASF